MSKIYWFIGQPKSGKTTIAKRLQFWLQTDKKNWRKSVFHIDELDIKNIYKIDNKDKHDSILFEKRVFDIVKYLSATNHDIVISTPHPYTGLRYEFKQELDYKEVYCHSKKIIVPKEDLILDFEPPTENFIQLDTTDQIDDTFKYLIKIIV